MAAVGAGLGVPSGVGLGVADGDAVIVGAGLGVALGVVLGLGAGVLPGVTAGLPVGVAVGAGLVSGEGLGLSVTAGDGLGLALGDGLGDAVDLASADCMGACAEPVSLALQGEGRASYLFSGVSPLEDVADILATCREYLAAPGGWIVDARPCGRLRLCLKGRIPALPRD